MYYIKIVIKYTELEINLWILSCYRPIWINHNFINQVVSEAYTEELTSKILRAFTGTRYFDNIRKILIGKSQEEKCLFNVTSDIFHHKILNFNCQLMKWSFCLWFFSTFIELFVNILSSIIYFYFAKYCVIALISNDIRFWFYLIGIWVYVLEKRYLNIFFLYFLYSCFWVGVELEVWQVAFSGCCSVRKVWNARSGALCCDLGCHTC